MKAFESPEGAVIMLICVEIRRKCIGYSRI